MKKDNIFIFYLRDRAIFGFLILIFYILMFLIYGLYGISYSPAVYTAIVMTSVLLVFAAVDFYRYKNDILYIKRLENLAQGHLGELGVSKNLKEESYRSIIRLLEQKSFKAAKQQESALNYSSEYYTLWSHQIKTPLSAFRLLLSETPLDGTALEQELLKTEQYVDMALQYQRLQKTSNDLLLKEYSLADLTRQTVKRVSSLFIHKKVSLELGDVSCKVLTDEKWLEFILEQLLTNAVKYTQAGGKVTVYLLANAPCTLVVKDTGIGILPEDLPRVFDWGYTGYNGRLDKRSTGIGLSMCHKAVFMLGNRISITSTVGSGTKVMLDLYRKDFDIK